MTRFSSRHSVDAPASGRLHQGIVAQVLVIVEVLVAERDPEDALGQHVTLLVGDACGVAWVGQGGVQLVDQSQVPIDLAEQQRPAVAGDVAAIEVGDDPLGAEAGKDDRIAVTVCHSDGLAPVGDDVVVNTDTTGTKAVAL